MDQAHKLRKLIQTTEDSPREVVAPLPMVVVSGARAGVGATTVAVNLAAVVADRGDRVLLVDADDNANTLADMTGVARKVEYAVNDVLAGKCTVSEAIVDGPVGMRVLANRRSHSGRALSERRISPMTAVAGSSQTTRNSNRAGLQRLLTGLDSSCDEVDVLVVDAGCGVTPWTQRLWLRAQMVVLVTTADDAAVVDAYTTVKRNASEGIRPAVRLLVNQAENDEVAGDACRRAQHACQRFLSLPMEALPSLPLDENGADGFGSLRVWESPHSPFGRAMLWVGKAVRERMEDRAVGESRVPSAAVKC